MDEEFVFCGTNIFKQFSDWLSGYDGLMSLAELFVEGLFLFFVLKEFKMTRQDFEWTKTDRREEKTKRELHYLAWCAVHVFTKIYKYYYDKQYMGTLHLLIVESDKETIKKICEDIAKKTFLPQSFCEAMIKSSITSLREQFQIGEVIDYYSIYDYFIGWANRIFTTNVLDPKFINQCNKYFKSDDEIDEIYEKLINNKL